MLWLALLGLALADEPVVPAAPPPAPEASEAEEVDPDAGYLTVVVIGQQQITAAKDAVVRQMEKLGWKTKRRNDGTIRFRGPESWMGRATLYASGDLDFDQPAIAFEGPKDAGGAYDAGSNTHNQYQGGTAGISVSMPSREKVDAIQREIRDAVHDEVLSYREKLQQRYFSSYIEELPARLDATWKDGVPLDGGRKALATPAARRAAILDFWSSRTDTPEGRTVSRAIEIWLRATVMDGPDAVTADEARAAEAGRADGRKLDVFPAGRAVMGLTP